MSEHISLLNDILSKFYEYKTDTISLNLYNEFKTVEESLFYSCIDKLEKDGYLVNVSNDKSKYAIYKISFDGLVFKEMGGYKEQEKINHLEGLEINLHTIKKRNAKLIAQGKWIFAIGIIALVLWEILKSVYNHLYH